MNKKYQVIVSDRSAAMLINHVRFLANVSVSAAQELRNDIISAAKELEKLPQRHPWFYYEGLPANKYRKKLVAKRYLLIYQIIDKNVYIDYVLDCRQDYKWLL